MIQPWKEKPTPKNNIKKNDHKDAEQPSILEPDVH